jgi:hypothetical protein
VSAITPPLVDTSSSTRLSAGAIVGIAVSISIVLALSIFASIRRRSVLRCRKTTPASGEKDDETLKKPELEAAVPLEKHSNAISSTEMEGNLPGAELQGDEPQPTELQADSKTPHEP